MIKTPNEVSANGEIPDNSKAAAHYYAIISEGYNIVSFNDSLSCVIYMKIVVIWIPCTKSEIFQPVFLRYSYEFHFIERSVCVCVCVRVCILMGEFELCMHVFIVGQ